MDMVLWVRVTLLFIPLLLLLLPPLFWWLVLCVTFCCLTHRPSAEHHLPQGQHKHTEPQTWMEVLTLQTSLCITLWA